jgi:hypothetical protein
MDTETESARISSVTEMPFLIVIQKLGEIEIDEEQQGFSLSFVSPRRDDKKSYKHRSVTQILRMNRRYSYCLFVMVLHKEQNHRTTIMRLT